MDGVCSACYYLLVGEERIQGMNLHAKGLCLLAYQAAHVTIGLNAKALALELASGSGSELGAGHEDHEAKSQFCNSVGVLAGGVHDYHAALCGGLKVYVVITGAGADHYLELGCCGHYFLGNLVRADDDGFNILYGSNKVCLCLILFKLYYFVTCLCEDFHDTVHSLCCEGFLGC